MADNNNLNNEVFNNEIGLFLTESGPITPDTVLSRPACWVIAQVGGLVQFENTLTGKSGLVPVLGGIMTPISYNKIIASGTTATGLYWGISDPYPFKKREE